MVSMVEINRDRIRELVDSHVLALYLALRDRGKVALTIKHSQAQKNIVDVFSRAGFSCEQIANVLSINKKRVKELKKARFTKGFTEAKSLLSNPILLLRKSDEYASEYNITIRIVEWLVIEDMAKAGWTAKQIVKALGVNKRRVYRIIKMVQENNNE